MATGVEFVTDYDREQCGLPPRGPEGWTVEELMLLERVRLSRMLAPPPMMILDTETGKITPAADLAQKK